MRTVRHFAAVGDVHGEHRAMVRLLRLAERRLGIELDLVLQVGDFEAHRNDGDVASMDAPSKYKLLGDFSSFYLKEEVFPWPVRFIAGNHEPTAFLEPHPGGLEVAPNCRYLGRVGEETLGGLRIAWLGGVAGERATFPHFSESEWEMALKLSRPDVLLLHEWPSGLPGAELEGGRRSLNLGNDHAQLLVEQLRPEWVACGHIHRRHRADLALPAGTVHVACLAAVRMGATAVAVFERTTQGIREME